MTYSVYQLLFFFTLYSIMGWCLEVIYHTVTKGKFVNRGFLNGPVCPIYGVTFTVVIICLTPLMDNIILLFAGSFLLTSIMEYVTGFILERIFHEKWWDYSKEQFDINGYVCIKFSLLWGLACMFTMYIIQQPIDRFVSWIPRQIGWTILLFAGIGFVSDITVTVFEIKKILAQLRIMKEITAKLRELSDSVGEEISDKTIEMIAKSEKGRKEYEELKEKYHALRYEKTFTHKRITTAFPHLKLEKNYHFSHKLKNDKK